MSLQLGDGLIQDETEERSVAKLIYSCLMSLDGYNEDEAGGFDWAAPDEAVHAFVNDLARPIGTQLLGRRTYDVLAVWDTMDLTAEPRPMVDFQAIWKASDKVVYSRSLDSVEAPRTRLEREFVPEAIRALKASSDRDIGIGGPRLAAQALRAGLVDELQLFLAPVVIGGGNRSLPDDLRLDLNLQTERRFEGGTVYLQYGVGGATAR
jgi:dihydrofolate reductase